MAKAKSVMPATDWTPFTLSHPGADDLADDIVFGAAIPGESVLRLLGDLEGRRVLELGCGAGHNAVRMAQRGARVIAVDPDADQLARAKVAADAAGVKVEFHHGASADLAFLRADGIDVALSAYGFVGVDDEARLIRQVHRVLKQQAPLVLSLPHPAFAMLHPGAEDPLHIRQSWFGESMTVAELFTLLSRNNYLVDVMVEPAASPDLPPASAWADVLQYVPPTMILRARKQGL